MLGGIGIGLLSGAKNKKIITIIGAVMAAIGIGGMVSIGYRINELTTGGDVFERSELVSTHFYTEYLFLFLILGGLILAIFGAVSIQRGQGNNRMKSSESA
jgi:NADH:ubiquinone oxidoreductase subunit 6 (subunit J)